MPVRLEILADGEIYHVLSKSIAGFKIFNNKNENRRMISTIRYYQAARTMRFSRYLELKKNKERLAAETIELSQEDKLIEIIAYCLMPTHLHLVLKQLKPNGIRIAMTNSLNSYACYFNRRHKRKGPLWEQRFKSIRVASDEQLLHLTRYLHLNPVTAFIVDKPEDWPYSSYGEYLSAGTNKKICCWEDVMSIKPRPYQKFVDERIHDQRQLSLIKKLSLE